MSDLQLERFIPRRSRVICPIPVKKCDLVSTVVTEADICRFSKQPIMVRLAVILFFVWKRRPRFGEVGQKSLHCERFWTKWCMRFPSQTGHATSGSQQ